MIEAIRSGIGGFVAAFAAFAPDGLAAVALLVLVAVAALVVHEVLARAIGRLTRGRSYYASSFLQATRPLTRLTFLVVALELALPAVPLAPLPATVIAKALLLASIALVGWLAIIALDLASELYLRRFQLETSDVVIARKHITQVRILHRAATTLLVVVTAGAALMTFDSVREFGLSLFASAGVASIVVGLAARPVLSNLIAGVQLAITQPIRIDDSVVVEGEFGTIEEIGSSYVLIRLWDLRRLVVPLTYFIEKPFQNWTRQGSALIGATMLYLDYTAPIERIRAKANDIVSQSPLWDGRTFAVQVTDTKLNAIEVRVLVGAASAGACFDLRAELREKLIDFLQRDIPHALPRQRNETAVAAVPVPSPQPPAHTAAPG